jgi:outer membrane protein assembly factor BamE (lipoprotein component of BamABCDE complex)
MSVRRLLYPVLVGLVAVTLAACLPIPLPAGDTSGTRLNIGGTAPEFIVVGKTTRADVLLALGEPDGASEHGERFTYTRVTSKGGVAIVGAGPGGTAAGSTERMVYRRLIITFDDQGVVASTRMESRSCSENTLQAYSSPACVDVHGRDVSSLDTLRTEEVTEAQAFPGLYWYPGVRGFDSFRGFSNLFSSKGVEEFQKHTLGTLVVGMSFVYFFSPEADRETAPLLKIPYDEIAEAYLDRLWGTHNVVCIVLKRKNGVSESFGVWDPYPGNMTDVTVVESAGKAIESRWKAVSARELPVK